MNKDELTKKNTKHKSLPHYMTATSRNTNVVGVIKISSTDLKENKSKPPPPSPSKPPTHKPSLSPNKPKSTVSVARARPKSLCLSSTISRTKPALKTPKGTIDPFNVTQSTKHPAVHVTSFKDPKLKKEPLTPSAKQIIKSVKTPKTKHMSMSFDAASLQKAREYEEKYGKAMVEPSPKSDKQNNNNNHNHRHHHHHHSSSNNSSKDNNNNNLESSCSSSNSSSYFQQSQHSQNSHHSHHHSHRNNNHHHNSADYFNNNDYEDDDDSETPTPPPPMDDIFEYSLPAFTIPSKIPKINVISSSTSSLTPSSITSSNNSNSSYNNNNNNSSSDSDIKYFSVPTLIDTPPSMIPDDLLDVPTLPPPPKYNMSDNYYLPPPSLHTIPPPPSQQQQTQKQSQKQQQHQQDDDEDNSYYYQQQQQQPEPQQYFEVSQIGREKTERELYEELRNEIYNNNNNIKSKKSSEITEDKSYYRNCISQIIILQRWYRELRKRHQDFYNEINRQPFALDGDHSYEDKNEKLKEETFSPSADDEFFSALNEGIIF